MDDGFDAIGQLGLELQGATDRDAGRQNFTKKFHPNSGRSVGITPKAVKRLDT